MTSRQFEKLGLKIRLKILYSEFVQKTKVYCRKSRLFAQIYEIKGLMNFESEVIQTAFQYSLGESNPCLKTENLSS